MLENGFIKLYRSLLKWEWYGDVNTTATFIHMLLKANFEDVKWRGIVIKRGSFVSSIAKMAKEIGITQMELRTAISHLKLTHEITQSSTNKYTVFTVNNYEKFQAVTYKTTNKQQSTNKQITIKQQQYKNNKEEIKKKKEIGAASPALPPGLLPIGESHINEGGDF